MSKRNQTKLFEREAGGIYRRRTGGLYWRPTINGQRTRQLLSSTTINKAKEEEDEELKRRPAGSPDWRHANAAMTVLGKSGLTV
jgi:hypothetical protein